MIPYFRSLRHFCRYRNYVLSQTYPYLETAERDNLGYRLRNYSMRARQFRVSGIDERVSEAGTAFCDPAGRGL